MAAIDFFKKVGANFWVHLKTVRSCLTLQAHLFAKKHITCFSLQPGPMNSFRLVQLNSFAGMYMGKWY
jgi:hypothetical protein